MSQISSLEKRNMYCSIQFLVLMLLMSFSTRVLAISTDENLSACLGPKISVDHTKDHALFQLKSLDPHLWIDALNTEIQRLKTQPYTSQLRLQLGYKLWRKGLVHDDMTLVSQALQLVTRGLDEANNDEAFILRAKINISLHRFAQAEQDLSQVVENAQQVDDLKLQISRMSGRKENLPLRSLDMYSLTNKIMLVDKYIGWGEYEQADRLFNRAVEMVDNDDPVGLVALHMIGAKLALGQNNSPLVLAHLQQAILRLPHHIGALKRLATYYRYQGDLNLSIGCLKLAKEYSKDPQLFGLLADSYALNNQHDMAQNMRDQAIEAYQRVLKRFPFVYAAKAADYFAAQAVDDAMLREAVKWACFDAKNRQLPEQWIRVADIYLQLNDFTRAKVALRLVQTRSDLALTDKQKIKRILHRMDG